MKYEIEILRKITIYTFVLLSCQIIESFCVSYFEQLAYFEEVKSPSTTHLMSLAFDAGPSGTRLNNENADKK
jgi:hypothetical protein